MGDPATPDDRAARAREIFARFLEEHGLEDDAAFGRLLVLHPDLMAALRELYVVYRGGPSTVEFVEGEHEEGDEGDAITDSAERVRSMIARLRAASNATTRLEERGEIARGGMGAIHRLFDPLLRRTLAKKVLIKDGARVGTDARKEVTIGRFLDEAQITAQLDHPGVVPVHDIGLDENGALWFTMRLVKGENLRAIFEKSRAGTDGWNLPRAVSVLLKVCETMAYAHGKDVIHRDVKPSNVMVGRFGETYVMDWGLARVLGRPDPRDLRIRPESASAASQVQTDLRDGGTPESPDSPLVTMDGQVVGTPAYMSPEQACGETEKMGKQSDVYSVGAALYELLAGHMPYVPRGRSASQRSILKWVQDGPPHPLRRQAPGAPPELVAICEKAMARRIRDRYPNMAALADDLRAWLEGRVVRAHQTGAVAEFVKWTKRNRATAAALAALVVVVAGAGFAVAVSRGNELETRREREAELALRLDIVEAEALVSDADRLWPVHPDTAPRMLEWLSAARALLAKKPEYQSSLDALGGWAPPADAKPEPASAEERSGRSILATLLETATSGRELLANPDLDASQRPNFERQVELVDREIEFRRRRMRRLELLRSEPPGLEAATAPDARRRSDLARFLRRVSVLDDPQNGLVVQIESRLRDAESVRARSIDAERAAWDAAIAAIGDQERCPRYGGSTIAPQVGLVPLHVDPKSGLHEFWHALSGERPRAGPDGEWKIEPETGIVLVLVPGGAFRCGASSDPASTRHDPSARPDEWVRDVELDPYFLAKHELTLAQWMRLADDLPSKNRPGLLPKNLPLFTFTDPVESVSFESAHRMLPRWSLVLPTEAQWERAARGDTDSVFWFEGGRISSECENFTDDARHGDEYPAAAPVDAFPPNPFGFCSMLGNAAEWCADWYCWKAKHGTVHPGTGELMPFTIEARVIRGGHFRTTVAGARVTYRESVKPTKTEEFVGIRACRMLDR